MINQEQNEGAIHEARTRKTVDIGGETFIPFRFLRACTFKSLSLTDGAVLIGGTLGEEDLSEKFSPDGVAVAAGTFLVLNVRNEADHAQEIVATIHASGEHGAEAEGIPLFANGSHVATSVPAPAGRGPREASNERPRETGRGREAAESEAEVSSAGVANGAPAPRGFPPIAAEQQVEEPPEELAEEPPPPPAVPTGTSRTLLFRPDAEALLAVFEMGALLSPMTRASLAHQFDASIGGDPTAEVTSDENDVILTLAAVDAERLFEAVQFHHEYHLEDTGILIEGLQAALGLIEQQESTTSGDTNEDDTDENEVSTSEPRSEKEEEDFRLAQRPASQARSLEANEGSLLSIAETIPGSPLDRNKTAETVPDQGNPPGNNGEGRDEHSSAVS